MSSLVLLGTNAFMQSVPGLPVSRSHFHWLLSMIALYIGAPTSGMRLTGTLEHLYSISVILLMMYCVANDLSYVRLPGLVVKLLVCAASWSCAIIDCCLEYSVRKLVLF